MNPADLKPMRLDKNVPLELYEARNAVQIARWTGAEKYAADTFAKATAGLAKAEGYQTRKAGKKPIDDGIARSSANGGRRPHHHDQEDAEEELWRTSARPAPSVNRERKHGQRKLQRIG